MPPAVRTERGRRALAGLPAGCLAALGLFFLAACEAPPVKHDGLRLTALSFADLPDWPADDHGAALGAFLRSCTVLTRPATKAASRDLALSPADWREPCAAAATVPRDRRGDARRFFEEWFRPYAAAGPDGPEGLFTGYFEIEIRGARARGEQHKVPIYRLPDDHVTANLGVFDPALDGRRFIGRVEDGKFVPYHTRGTIEGGALSGRGFEMLWIDDPVDVFMLHVQGSGRVILPDGDVVRVGYAGHNGHEYSSIGRALIERGELKRGQASWRQIRDWIDHNPEKTADLFAVNPRFVFFRFIDELPADAGPIGAEGVPLTPERSLAVDRRYVPYGLPIWLDTVWPGEPGRPLRRLMVAQDTGGAIKGVVRGDFFWGYGDAALKQAGRMKSRGRYFLLVPVSAAARLTQS